MMNKMMHSMIKGMSVEEREDMMLKMMPEMMKRVDVKIMAPHMLKTLGSMITLYSVYDILAKALKDDELKASLGEKFKLLKEKLPEMMSMMMPMMMSMMSKVMPKMMSFMMPVMSDMMDSFGEDGCMTGCDEEMKTAMAGCMQKMMPHCVEMIFPSMDKNEKASFALQIVGLLYHQTVNCMDDSEKRNFNNDISEIFIQNKK